MNDKTLYKVLGMTFHQVVNDPNRPSTQRFAGKWYAKLKLIPNQTFKVEKGVAQSFLLASENDEVTQVLFLSGAQYSQYKAMVDAIEALPNKWDDAPRLVNLDVFQQPTEKPFYMKDTETGQWRQNEDGTLKIYHSIRVIIEVRNGIRMLDAKAEADRLVKVFGQYVPTETATPAVNPAQQTITPATDPFANPQPVAATVEPPVQPAAPVTPPTAGAVV